MSFLDTFVLILYTATMSVANNFKQFRGAKKTMQKEVYNEIRLKPTHYNKLEKGLVEPSIAIFRKTLGFLQCNY